MKYREAIAAGAMAFFTEKYGDIVRVVDVPGISLELCGGTHVPTTGQIALFRFTHETGAAAGVRRIEAVTGPVAYELVRKLEQQVDEAASVLKTQPEHLVRRIEQLLEENKKLEKRMQELLKQGAGSREQGAVEQIGDIALYIDQSDLVAVVEIALVDVERDVGAVHERRAAGDPCRRHRRPGGAGREGRGHRGGDRGGVGWQGRRAAAFRVGGCRRPGAARRGARPGTGDRQAAARPMTREAVLAWLDARRPPRRPRRCARTWTPRVEPGEHRLPGHRA